MTPFVFVTSPEAFMEVISVFSGMFFDLCWVVLGFAGALLGYPGTLLGRLLAFLRFPWAVVMLSWRLLGQFVAERTSRRLARQHQCKTEGKCPAFPVVVVRIDDADEHGNDDAAGD